jgi:hypothetical protein
MLRRFLALVLMVVVGTGAALFVTALPAAASCAAAPTIPADLERADLVFVGTVTRVENDDRWATFQIEDVWKGDPGGQEVVVRAGPANPGNGIKAGSTVDRTFESGGHYLVFAYDPGSHGYTKSWGDDSRFEDNNCSATTLYAPSFDQFRPATAHRVEATLTEPTTPIATAPSTETSDSELPRDLALALGVAAVIVLVLAARSFSRRSRRRRPETSLLA